MDDELAFIALTSYPRLLPDWRGLLIAWLSLIAVANIYLSAFTRLRVDIRKDRAEVETLTRRAG